MPEKVSTVKKNQNSILQKNANSVTKDTSSLKKDQKVVGSVLSGKQHDPDRGQGTDRRPNVPKGHLTGPTMESTNMDESIASFKNKMKKRGLLHVVAPRKAAAKRAADSAAAEHDHKNLDIKDPEHKKIAAKKVARLMKTSGKISNKRNVWGKLGVAESTMDESVEITGTWVRTGKPFKRKFSSPQEAAAYTKNNGIKVTDRRDSLGEVRMRLEARASEFRAHSQLSSSSKSNRKPGHYLMRNGSPLHSDPHKTPEAALGAFKKMADNSGVKIVHVKEETVNELSKKTLGSYIKKASTDAVNKAGEGSWKHAKSQDDGHPDDGEKEDRKAVTRLKGVAKATDKLTKETWETKRHLLPVGQNKDSDMIGTKLKAGFKKDAKAINAKTKAEKEAKKTVKEDAPAMSSGAAGDPGHVQNPTDNYASQKKKLSVIRRKAVK